MRLAASDVNQEHSVRLTSCSVLAQSAQATDRETDEQSVGPSVGPSVRHRALEVGVRLLWPLIVAARHPGLDNSSEKRVSSCVPCKLRRNTKICRSKRVNFQGEQLFNFARRRGGGHRHSHWRLSYTSVCPKESPGHQEEKWTPSVAHGLNCARVSILELTRTHTAASNSSDVSRTSSDRVID